MTDEDLIRAALEAARAAGPRDVPIGAVVFAADGTELARAANAREELGDPTAHAEILALRAAAGVLGDGWRLEGTTLAVTVEPCTMCAGALVMARVARVVFGAWEPKTGAVGSLWDVVRDRQADPPAAGARRGAGRRVRGAAGGVLRPPAVTGLSVQTAHRAVIPCDRRPSRSFDASRRRFGRRAAHR